MLKKTIRNPVGKLYETRFGDVRRLGYKPSILVSLGVLMTKRHHSNCQSILLGALEEIIGSLSNDDGDAKDDA